MNKLRAQIGDDVSITSSVSGRYSRIQSKPPKSIKDEAVISPTGKVTHAGTMADSKAFAVTKSKTTALNVSTMTPGGASGDDNNIGTEEAKAQVEQEVHKLEKLEKEKSKLKDGINSWLDDFQQVHKRPADKIDRIRIRDQYELYNEVGNGFFQR